MNSATSQQLYGIPQTPILEVQSAQSVNKLEKYKTRMVKFGKTEIVVGGIIFILDFVFLLIGELHDKYRGIWCGSVLIASGIMGVVTRSRQAYRVFVANVAMSLLAALFMVVLVSQSIIFVFQYPHFTHDDGSDYKTEFAIQAVIAGFGFVALIITVLHFGYSSAGACHPNGPTLMSMPVQMSNGQVMLFANQTTMNSGTGQNSGETQSNESVPAQEHRDLNMPPPYSCDP